MRTPLTVITGPLGGGKTTLLRHLLDSCRERLAILMSEFGEPADGGWQATVVLDI